MVVVGVIPTWHLPPSGVRDAQRNPADLSATFYDLPEARCAPYPSARLDKRAAHRSDKKGQFVSGVLTFCGYMSASVALCWPKTPHFAEGVRPHGRCGRTTRAQILLLRFA